MIQLTLLRSKRKHLFNPDLIQEAGAYTCTEHGAVRDKGREPYDTAPLEERNFVVMQGCEPLDIVEEANSVSLLRESWRMRRDLSPFSLSSYVMFDDDGSVAFMGVQV